jgi:hypothetical protein
MDPFCRRRGADRKTAVFPRHVPSTSPLLSGIRLTLADVTRLGHPSPMGFPPPPPDGPPPPPEQSGGFGPPQGFGPPPPPQGDGGYGQPAQPAQPYGYPQQGGQPAQPYGYPQQAPGYGPPGQPGPPAPPGGYGYGDPQQGFGYPPPPPPPNHKKRNAWIAVGTVVVVGAIIGGVIAASGGDDKKKNTADDKPTHSLSGLPSGLPTDTDLPTPSFTIPSIDPSLDLPTDLPTDLPSDDSTDGDQKLVPYVVLSPGTCFDAPTLTPSVSEVTKRSCSSAHDAQVVANETLTGTFSSDSEIQSKALQLCTKDAEKHLPSDGRTYYPYALFPKLVTFELQGKKTVTCSLTRNNGTSGTKLYSKL